MFETDRKAVGDKSSDDDRPLFPQMRGWDRTNSASLVFYKITLRNSSNNTTSELQQMVPHHSYLGMNLWSRLIIVPLAVGSECFPECSEPLDLQLLGFEVFVILYT